jgi:hypothetical protein
MKEKKTMPKREQRFIPVKNVEIRTSESGEGDSVVEQRYVSGTGIVYGEEVEIWSGYMEQVRAGAFDDTFAAGDEIKSYFNHNQDYVLATTRSNPPLKLSETKAGLVFEAPIPPTSYGEDLAVNLERGNVAGASFSFSVVKDVVTIDEKDVYHREIVKAILYEVGPVTNPAYPTTEVGVRDKEQSFAEIRSRIEKQISEDRDSEGSELEIFRAEVEILELT